MPEASTGRQMPPDPFTLWFTIALLGSGVPLLVAGLAGIVGPQRYFVAALGFMLLLLGIPALHDLLRPDRPSWLNKLTSRSSPTTIRRRVTPEEFEAEKKALGLDGPAPKAGAPAAILVTTRGAGKQGFVMSGLPPGAVARFLQNSYPGLTHRNPQKRMGAVQKIGYVAASLSSEQKAEARRRIAPLSADEYQPVRDAAAATLALLD